MTGTWRPHVLLVVENVALARDHRLGKQVSSLHSHGYRVTVICRDDPGNECPAGVGLRTYRAPADGTGKLSFAWEYGYSFAMAAWLAAGVFRRDPFDAIQVSGTPDIYFALAAPYRLLGRPLVVDQRDLSPELYELRYGRRGAVHRALCWLERRSYRAADQVITVNATLREVALTRGGLPPEAVTVVGNGPVLASTRRRPPLRELKHGKPFLGCWLGHMGPQDRVDLALRAVAHLVHDIGRTDCHFAFVGDGEERIHAIRRAAHLGISDWVSFPGWAGQDEAFTYLSTADIGLEPNMEEIVSPVKGMEYMAFGLPFVSFDLTETRALAGEAAVYAQPGDVAGFARLIDELLSDPVRRAELGQAGRQLVAERVAWDRQEDAYLGVYERLLGKPRPGLPAPAVGELAGMGVEGRRRSRRPGREVETAVEGRRRSRRPGRGVRTGV